MIRACVLVLLFHCFASIASAEDIWTAQDYERVKMLVANGPDALISPTEGLTDTGCYVLFPGHGVAECLAVWHKMNFFERCAYLKNDGFALTRGVLQYLNERSAVWQFRKEDPDISAEEIAVALRTLYAEKSAYNCMLTTRIHMDYCVFLFQRIAVADEVVRALRFMKHHDRVVTELASEK